MKKSIYLLLFIAALLCSCEKEKNQDFRGWERDLNDFTFLFNLSPGDTCYYVKGKYNIPAVVEYNKITLERVTNLNDPEYGTERRRIKANLKLFAGDINIDVVVTDKDALHYTATLEQGYVDLEIFVKTQSDLLMIDYYGKETYTRFSLFMFKQMSMKQVGNDARTGIFKAGTGIDSFEFDGNHWVLDHIGKLKK